MIQTMHEVPVHLLILNIEGHVKKSVGNILELKLETWKSVHIYEVIPLLESVLSNIELPLEDTLSFPRVEFQFDLLSERIFNIHIKQCPHSKAEICFRCFIEDITAGCQSLIRSQQSYQSYLIALQTKL